MNELFIASIRTLDDPVFYKQAYDAMSIQRKEKIDHYHGSDDKKRSIASELLIKEALNSKVYELDELVHEFGPYGKPYLLNCPDFHFSVSHSNDYVILAVSDKEIGCDIEKLRKYDLNVAKRFFTTEEYQELLNCENEEERKKLFFRLWTMKESYIKYTGEGLHCPLDSFLIETDADGNRIINKDNKTLFLSESDILNDYFISVCSPDKQFETRIINLK